jgi:hypothetical protein
MKAKVKESADSETNASMPTTMGDFIPIFANVREKSGDLQTGLTEILQAINEVYPEAQISVELEEQ